MARTHAGKPAAVDAQGSIDGGAAAQGTIATDATTAAAASVTDRTTAIDAGAAAPLADVAVAAPAPEAGPRAKKESKADAAVDVNAWAAATVAGAASAEHASGQSANGNGTNGRGRDGHPENFGGLVSSLRHASEGGVQGLSPAFEARSLMASAINAQVDPHDASATAATTIVTTAPPDEQAAQIVRSMRLHWRGSVGEAQLRLTPEHLGQVLVSVKVDQGSVTATMHAETPAAQQWIQAHQQQLRDALDAQGLRVAELQVTTDPEDRPRRDHQDQQEKPRGRAQTRARDDEAPRFEIRM
jgi:flagellar hook-length control protein FliK